jgi:hypothetical protein
MPTNTTSDSENSPKTGDSLKTTETEKDRKKDSNPPIAANTAVADNRSIGWGALFFSGLIALRLVLKLLQHNNIVKIRATLNALKDLCDNTNNDQASTTLETNHNYSLYSSIGSAILVTSLTAVIINQAFKKVVPDKNNDDKDDVANQHAAVPK